jgi:hypothetical protein
VLGRWARRLVLPLVLTLPFVALGPAGCGKKETPAEPQKAASLDPVPAPAGLVADVFVPSPDASWAKARATVGGPALFLPSSASGLMATLLGLPLAAGPEIDGQIPAVGAIVAEPDGQKPRSVLGMHVKAGDRLIDLLVKGQDPRFVAKPDEKTSITMLLPKAGGTPTVYIGVLGNYLLVGREQADVLEVGPYVARTLPRATMPKDDVAFELPKEALAGPIAKGLRQSWEDMRPKGRETDPASLAGAGGASLPSPANNMVEALLAILGDLDHARVTLNLDERAARLRFLGTPKGGGAGVKSIEAMTVGDPRALYALPAETEAALYLRDGAATRVSDAKQYAAAIARAMGGEVPDADRAAIEAALTGVAEGRGDAFAAGFSILPTGPAAYVRAEVADGDKLGKSLEDLFGLAKLPSMKAWLGQAEIGVSTGKTALEGTPGEVRRVRVERLDGKDEKGKGKAGAKDDAKGKKADGGGAAPGLVPDAIDVLYMLGKEGLLLAAGYDAKGALRAVLDAPGKENLGGRAEVKGAIEAVGDQAALLMVIDPMRLLARQTGAPNPGPSAPVVFAVGKGGKDAAAAEPWMRLDVANAAIQELVRRRGAF